ncbi:Uncharacterised protein [Oligella urethralis]|nr:Uncharacterised protein [Oligella urethralis]
MLIVFLSVLLLMASMTMIGGFDSFKNFPDAIESVY